LRFELDPLLFDINHLDFIEFVGFIGLLELLGCCALGLKCYEARELGG
jgi:hypothetical protein